MITKFILNGVVATMLITASTASAAVIVDLKDKTPEEDSLLSILAPKDPTKSTGSIGSRNQESGHNPVAFAFQANYSGLMNEFGLELNGGDGGGGARIEITIRERESISSSVTAGTTLSSFITTIDVETGKPYDTTWLSFDLSGLEDGGIQLQEGLYYTIQLKWLDTPSSSQRIVIRTQQTSDLNVRDPNGAGSWDSASWTRRDNRDYFYYAAGVRAIPEPSSYAMIGLTTIGIAVYRRRKKTQ